MNIPQFLFIMFSVDDTTPVTFRDEAFYPETGSSILYNDYTILSMLNVIKLTSTLGHVENDADDKSISRAPTSVL
jgi:hypothetical protein